MLKFILLDYIYIYIYIYIYDFIILQRPSKPLLGSSQELLGRQSHARRLILTYELLLLLFLLFLLLLLYANIYGRESYKYIIPVMTSFRSFLRKIIICFLLDIFLSLVFQKSETQLQISNLTKVLVHTLCKVNTLSLLILDYSVYLMQCFLMDIYPLC